MIIEERLSSELTGKSLHMIRTPEEEQIIDEYMKKTFGNNSKATERTLQDNTYILKSIDATLKNIDRTLIQLQNQFSALGVSRSSLQMLTENSTD